MSILKQFGRNPKPEQIKSSFYKNGSFQNQPFSPRKVYLEGHKQKSTLQIAYEFFLKKKPESIEPTIGIPSQKTDLKTLKSDTPTLIWMGHSSYFIKYQNKTFLIDPVMSGHASPFKFMINAFKGTDIYSYDDIPEIDYLIITHDHYDHLDCDTVNRLKHKIKKIIAPIGVAEHFKSWNFQSNIITELDWWESHKLQSDWFITATPTQHFSGRTFDRNQTLWASYVLELNQFRLYIGGDSGYGIHFQQIGQKFKKFDLAILECGQYNPNWPDVHMFPEETALAAQELDAQLLLPVHWGKFVLSTHPWTDSIERVLIKSNELNIKTTTPMIGEPLVLNSPHPQSTWWK